MQAMLDTPETDSTRPATTVASQLSYLKMKEDAAEKKSFNTFYAVYPTAEDNKVKFERVNKFAGKSSYLSYVPAKKNTDERVMEAAWNEYQNKKL